MKVRIFFYHDIYTKAVNLFIKNNIIYECLISFLFFYSMISYWTKSDVKNIYNLILELMCFL